MNDARETTVIRPEAAGARARLSIVVPVFNEEAGLRPFHRRLSAVLDALEMTSEILFVNDGSDDESVHVIRDLRQEDGRIALVDLSRNFGKELALTAGLDHAGGDAVIIIDADLQDPPELIPQLIARWRDGYDVVYAKRMRREGDSWLKRVSARYFYRLMQRTGRVRIPEDTGDFRLLSRRAVIALARLRERHRFMKGLFTWIGYPQVAVEYERDPRFAGHSKWNYWGLWNFALEGFTSFTVAPLKVATYIGVLTAVAAFAFGAVIIAKTLLFGRDLPGYPSLMVVILFIGGIQLVALGLIGEYLGRIFNEAKGRPLYIVQEYTPAPGESSTSRDPGVRGTEA
jgi:glycosyltransferase involved in cell wall biosynthesis